MEHIKILILGIYILSSLVFVLIYIPISMYESSALSAFHQCLFSDALFNRQSKTIFPLSH